MENLPELSVIAPTGVPFTETEIKGKGSPVMESVTIPFIIFWASDLLEIALSIISMIRNEKEFLRGIISRNSKLKKMFDCITNKWINVQI